MKNKTITISLSLFILSAVIIFSIVEYRKLAKKYNQLYGGNEAIRVENTLLKEGFFHSYDYETVPINFTSYVQNYKLDSILLNSILQYKKTLILFVHVESCTGCTYENIKRIKKLQKDSELDILIGIEGLSFRKFQAFVSNNDIKDFAYRLPDRFFQGFYLNPVVYFVVDETLETRYFFAPSNIYPQLTQEYFNKLQRML